MSQRDDRGETSVASQLRAITRVRELMSLLDRRPDLAGVYVPADLTAELLRWSA